MTSFVKLQHTLTIFFTSTASDLEFALTNVYAPANHRDSLGFLEDLAEVASHIPACWALAGNFNLTRGADENINGNVHQHLADAFNDSIHSLGLIDLPLLDRLFTWSNHQSTPTLARLDRVLLNTPMAAAFPNSSLTSLPKPTSDHTPILLSLSTSIPKPNVFCFENGWLKHHDFLPTILPAWQEANGRNAAVVLVGSLKAVRGASKF